MILPVLQEHYAYTVVSIKFIPVEVQSSDNQHFDVDRYLQLTRRTRYYPELTAYYGQEWSLNSIIGNFESLLRADKCKGNKRDYIAEINRYLNYYR